MADISSIPYSKPATSIPDQIKLLKQRGLILDCNETAEHCLSHIGYYRLAGYWQVFQVDPANHTFKSGTTFTQIIELYSFDREIRLLLLDAIERIEISVRSMLVNEMSIAYTPTWYSERTLAYEITAHEDLMEKIDTEIKRANEDFIKSHQRKYGSADHLPSWVVMQVISLGTLSKIYGNIHNSVAQKKAIAKSYGLPAAEYLHSWLQVVAVLRNHCAHHSRICYRRFSFPPREMRREKLPWIKNIPPKGSMLAERFYYQACIVRYLLHTAAPKNNFTIRLKELFKKYPSVNATKMGFPAEWQNESLWA